MAGPLSGVRVIDLTQVVSGPWATMLLADQGADVVKIEPVAVGEVLRPAPNFRRGDVTAFYANCNRGKAAVAIDLAQPEGQAIVRRMLGSADVFVENFRPGAAARLGLDAAALRAEHPRLITCSITGFGEDGPWSGRPVYDPVIQAMTGHADVQVNPDIPFPDLVRTAVADKSTSLMTAQAITAALFERERSGTGQHVSLSMLDCSLNFFWPDGMMKETVLEENSGGVALYDVYRLVRCADGHITYIAGRFEELHRMMRAVGHPEWTEDPRWSTPEALRSDDNRERFGALLTDALEAMTVAEAVAALQAHDVAVGPLLGREEVLAHEQVVHNGRVVEWEHPTAGRLRQVLPAADFSATPNDVRLSLSLHGEDTDRVLADLGYTDAELAELRTAGVIG